MIRTLFTVCLAFIAMQVTGQSKYELGMEKAFELWKSEKPWEAANLFERISKAEPENWLPPFYAAQINVFNSFNEADKEKMVAQMNKARKFLDQSAALTTDNPEILVLEAQLLTAWVVYDGQQYGMKYSARIAELYQQAAELAPENPRVVFGKAQWDIGSARFFGKSTDVYCDDIKRAIELFENEQPAGPFYPIGGGEYAKQVLTENCGN